MWPRHRFFREACLLPETTNQESSLFHEGLLWLPTTQRSPVANLCPQESKGVAAETQHGQATGP